MISRRALFGLFVGGAAVASGKVSAGVFNADAVEVPIIPRGYISDFVDSYTETIDIHGNAQFFMHRVRKIWDGAQFIRLDTQAGQEVVRSMMDRVGVEQISQSACEL